GETAAGFGEQRIYASHNSIMFSRRACYFFVRPKRKHLEVCVFLGRTVRAPQVKRVTQSSKAKMVHIIHITHRDEVEAPITDWLQEAYEYSGEVAARRSAGARPPPPAVRESPAETRRTPPPPKPPARPPVGEP